MQKNLLLGNGINIHFGINALLLDNIATRFKAVLINSSPLYECLFDVPLTPSVCDSLFTNASDLGIETLSAEIYKYVYMHMNDKTSINNEYRLNNAVKTSAINAIFYNNEKPISIPPLNPSTVNTLKKYQSIHTLNYTEFWDTENLCTYLHGTYKPITPVNNGKPILLYNSRQYHLPDYKRVVNSMKTIYNMLVFNDYNIVFSPLLDKQKILGTGHYPAKNLYPANDLPPFAPPKLYTELDSISSLDVFGMSPYGDDKLIKLLANVPNLSIYVYQMDSIQVSEWNKKLKRNCCKDNLLFGQ